MFFSWRVWKREFFSLLYSSSLCTDIARSVRRPASRSSYYYRLLAQYFWLFLADILLRYLRDLHRVVRPDTRLPPMVLMCCKALTISASSPCFYTSSLDNLDVSTLSDFRTEVRSDLDFTDQ